MTGCSQIECGTCQLPLRYSTFNKGDFSKCSSCGTPSLVYVFPAFFAHRQLGPANEGLLLDKEASCFYHPRKKAVTHCELCGRFLCSLCDVEFQGQHVCPACIRVGKEKGKIKDLEDSRVLYDDLALSVAIIPLLFFFLTFVTAPISIYISVRYWNASGSIIPRTKIRFIIAIILSFLQITGWGLFFYYR